MRRANIPDRYLQETRLDRRDYRRGRRNRQGDLALAALPMLSTLVGAVHRRTLAGRRPTRTAAAAGIGWDSKEARLGGIVAQTVSYVERDAIFTHDALAVLLTKAARLRYGSLVAVAYWGSPDLDPPEGACTPVLHPDQAGLGLLRTSKNPRIADETLFFSGDNNVCHGQVYTLPQLNDYHTAAPGSRQPIVRFGLPAAPGERYHDNALLGYLGALAAEVYDAPYDVPFRQLAAAMPDGRH